MKQIYITIGLLLGSLSLVVGQEASLQLIHNSIDPNLEKIDVYWGEKKIADAISLHQATAFVAVPAGEALVTLTPSGSTGTDEALVQFQSPALEADVKYVGILNGLLEAPGVNPFINDNRLRFKLLPYATEQATDVEKISLASFHGALSHPTADMLLGTHRLIEQIGYGSFTRYQTVNAMNYVLELVSSTNPNEKLGIFNVEAEAWKGKSVMLFSSEKTIFTEGDTDFEVGLYAALPNGEVVALEGGDTFDDQLAQVQFIHSAADPLLQSIDIYLGDQLLKGEIAYLEASNFMAIPGDNTYTVKVVSSGDPDISQEFEVSFEAGKRYVAIAHGLMDVQLKQTSENPDSDFALSLFDEVKPESGSEDMVALLGFQGVADLTALSVNDKMGPWLNPMTYGGWVNYVDKSAEAHQLSLTTDTDTLGKFSVDLSELGGTSIVLFTSGLTSVGNVGLYGALSDGEVVVFENAGDTLPENTPKDSLEPQILVAQHPVYGQILTDAVGNTLYHFAPDIEGISACTGGCVEAWPIFDVDTLTVGEGLDPTDFEQITHPDGGTQLTYKGWPLYYYVDDQQPEEVNGDGKNEMWFVAKPDYSLMVGYQEVPVDGALAYLTNDRGETIYIFEPDTAYKSECEGGCYTAWPGVIPAQNMVLPSILNLDEFQSFERGDGSAQLAFRGRPLYYFEADEQDFGVVSGHPANDVWFVADLAVEGLVPADTMPNDTIPNDTIPTPKQPKDTVDTTVAQAFAQFVHNAAGASLAFVDLYVGEELIADDMAFREATAFLPVDTTEQLILSVAPSNSNSYQDALRQFRLPIFEAGQRYMVVTSGVWETDLYDSTINDPIDLRVKVLPGAQQHSEDTTTVNIALYHGVSDASELGARYKDAVFADSIPYLSFTSYRPLPLAGYEGSYVVTLFPTAQPADTLGNFQVDIQNLGGKAVFIFASGFVTPANNNQGPLLGLFAAFPDGTVHELPRVSSPDTLSPVPPPGDTIPGDTIPPVEMPGDTCESIQLANMQFTGFGGRQDEGAAVLRENDNAVYLYGNAWKSIALTYEVTEKTILEFDFKSGQEGEIQGIGFDDDAVLSSDRIFKVYGTQNWGITAYDDYEGDGYKRYQVPVGQFYTGTFDRLVLVMDHDKGLRNGNGYFHNIQVFEANTCGDSIDEQTMQASLKLAYDPLGAAFEPEVQVDVFPVPVEDRLNFHIAGMESFYDFSIRLVDLQGKVLERKVVSQQDDPDVQMVFSMERYAPGLYFLQLVNEANGTTIEHVKIAKK